MLGRTLFLEPKIAQFFVGGGQFGMEGVYVFLIL